MSVVSIIARMVKKVVPVLPPTDTLLFIFNGESNSGGLGANSGATSHELSVRSSIQILNNYTLLFEDLHIGVNNILQHAGFNDSGPNNQNHGWELGLANKVEANAFPQTQAHLVKTGQGGSLINEWNVGGDYMNKFTNRITAAISGLTSSGKTYQPVIFYTQGINDFGTTDSYVWKTATINHFADLRNIIGGTIPIMMTMLPPTSQSGNINSDIFNQRILEIADTDPLVYAIQTSDAELRDVNHWDYSGMKLIASRMVDKTLELL